LCPSKHFLKERSTFPRHPKTKLSPLSSWPLSIRWQRLGSRESSVLGVAMLRYKDF
jgi:hypothetical protein